MMEFKYILKLYNSLYTKEKLHFIPEHSLQTNMMFMRWLMREPKLLPIIRPLVDYLFYVKPKHFYYLLYTHIPPRKKAPKIKKKGKKIKKKQDRVVNKIIEVLGWSEIQFEKNCDIVEKTILDNRKYWEQEFGFRVKR